MDIYEEIVKLRQQGRRGAVATIVNVRGSIPSFETAKMLVRDDGSIAGTIGGGCVEAEIWQGAREVMGSEKPRTLTFKLNQDPKKDTGLGLGRQPRYFRRASTSSSSTIYFRRGPRIGKSLQGSQRRRLRCDGSGRPRGLRQPRAV